MIEYDLSAITPPYVTEYLRSQIKPRDGILSELERFAAGNDIPIAQPETAQFLSVMCRLKRPSKILEVGTAIGYSAIVMARSTRKGCRIMSIEYDEGKVHIARENVKRAGFADRIDVIEGDANDYLPYIENDGSFDMIFLDGPKAHYVNMLDECVRLLRRGGLLISDNILYKGMTADDNHVVRRKITIVKRLRAYIDALANHKELETSILPLGDGVTVSVKL